MSTSKSGKAFFFFLAGWLVLGWLQAFLTELDPDEAYYWVYSTKLDWGYFDHPPMVALMIKAGYALFKNELGVRLLFPIAQVVSFWFIWDLVNRPTERREVTLLIVLLAAMPLLNIYGFVATPDGPLLLFSTMFLWIYNRFANNSSWTNTLVMGAAMALLLYSKYHGVVLIFCVLASNLSLLRNPRFYIASIFGAALFFPHLFWQYTNDFPSFRYHLSGRDDIYEIKYTTTYLLNQLVVFSPLLFPLIIQAIRKTTLTDLMNRAYVFVIGGFWFFFFLASFKGHAEPQWTGLLSIPIVMLLFQHGLNQDKFRNWAIKLGLASFVLLFVVRTLLVYNFLGIKSDFHNKAWTEELKILAEGHTVWFENAYRNAAKYMFYAKADAYTFTNVEYRRNQFDIWYGETELQGKDVLAVVSKERECSQCEPIRLGWRDYKTIEVQNLQVSGKIEMTIVKEGERKLQPNRLYNLDVEIYNPYDFEVLLDDGVFPLNIGVFFLERGEHVLTQPASLITGLPKIPTGLSTQRLQFQSPNKLRSDINYQMGIGFYYAGLPASLSSNLIEISMVK